MNERKSDDSTVLFFEKGEAKVGRIKKKSNKYLTIITPEGEEKTISEIQVFRTFEKSDLQKIMEAKNEIDLCTLWEVSSSTPDLKQIKEEEIISIHNPNFTLEEKIALSLKLYSKENIYFKNIKDNLWMIRDPKDVKNLQIQIEEEKEKKEKVKKFRDWILNPKIIEKVKVLKNVDIKIFFSENYPTFDEEIPDFVKGILQKLKKFFTNEKEEDIIKEAFAGIIELKRAEVFKILVFFKILNPYENFFLEKFKVPAEECKIEVEISYDGKKREKINIPTYSIDVEGTEIRDDAVSETKLSDTIEMFVHVADTSLLDKSDIINEVIKRGKSVYLPEGKIDMLPKKAVKELSLDAGIPKPAITFKIKFSLGEKIEIKNVDISKTEILVNKNYEFSDDVEDIKRIKEIGLELHNKRVKMMGGVDLISDDFLILIDSKCEFITERWKVNDMRIAIAEISMLCSYAIGWFCAKNSIPVFFRRSKIDPNIRSEIQRFNVESSNFLPRYYIIWRNIRASRYIETTTEPSGAESLGYDFYAWGTSPLRRGWDFINIIQISRYLEGQKCFSTEELSKMKEKLEVSISRTESAEDLRYKYILAIYIMKKLSDKQIEASIVEKNKESIYWIEEILSFLKGKNPRKAEVLDNLKIYLKSDPINLKITPIPVE